MGRRAERKKKALSESRSKSLSNTQGLLLSTPPQAPPAALRSRLRERLTIRQPGAQKNARPRLSWSIFPAVLALATALMVFLAVFALFQIQSLKRQQAQLSSQLRANQMALAMLAYPDTQTLPFTDGGISGSLLLDQDRNVAALIAWDLPQLEKDQTYQV
ncbi:MAG: anti-sigma factor [Anaerolineales bacterium]|nr:anti-sigma factor [Anaerolineales bacterium]